MNQDAKPTHERVMRTFKIHLRSGDIVTVQGERLYTIRDPEKSRHDSILEVIIDLPMKEYAGTEYAHRTSPTVVAVFPLSELKAAFEGEFQQ